jgi:hypothetical protein
MEPQVIDFRTGKPAPVPTPAPGGYLPSFPTLAAQVERHAVKIPWYVWLAAGAYAMYRIKKG